MKFILIFLFIIVVILFLIYRLIRLILRKIIHTTKEAGSKLEAKASALIKEHKTKS